MTSCDAYLVTASYTTVNSWIRRRNARRVCLVEVSVFRKLKKITIFVKRHNSSLVRLQTIGYVLKKS